MVESGDLDGDARDELAHLRKTVAEVANENGVSMMAASTHPFAVWDTQRRTPRERYADLERDLQAVVRRLMISGMHVHVEIEDEELGSAGVPRAEGDLPQVCQGVVVR